MIGKFQNIINHPNRAKMMTLPKQNTQTTKWILPSVFGDKTKVTNEVLPLGFLHQEHAPDPLRLELFLIFFQ